MNDDAYRQHFTRIFLMNVERRSRTAKGKDEGAKTSSSKRPLLLQGNALAAQVRANMDELCADVYTAIAARTAPSVCRAFGERWFDIANLNVYGAHIYAKEFAELRLKAAQLRRSGMDARVNERYRVWTPGYAIAQVHPLMLEEQMDRFYRLLSERLSDIDRRVAAGLDPHEISRSILHLMAITDVWMDGELHPWIDGCSRVATAFVMWVAARYRLTPPLFAPARKEHYATIQDAAAHEDYLRACLERADAEVPD